MSNTVCYEKKTKQELYETLVNNVQLWGLVTESDNQEQLKEMIDNAYALSTLIVHHMIDDVPDVAHHIFQSMMHLFRDWFAEEEAKYNERK